MRLLALEKSQWTVAAVVGSRASRVECEVLQFLSGQEARNQAHARGMRVLFQRYARGGRRLLTIDLLHHADQNEGILEFRKGGLRVFCFEDADRRLIVLTTGCIKKGNKADKKAVGKAIALKKEYLAAAKSGDIEWLSMDGNSTKRN